MDETKREDVDPLNVVSTIQASPAGVAGPKRALGHRPPPPKNTIKIKYNFKKVFG